MSTDRQYPQAATPADLHRLLAERGNAKDLDGIVELYEPNAVLAFERNEPAVGHAAIREAFAGLLAQDIMFSAEGQRPPLEVGDLAITTATFGPASYTCEVARRQPDGSWRWVIDIPDFLA
jgi:ketosteroid isomerase-like protein